MVYVKPHAAPPSISVLTLSAPWRAIPPQPSNHQLLHGGEIFGWLFCVPLCRLSVDLMPPFGHPNDVLLLESGMALKARCRVPWVAPMTPHYVPTSEEV